MPTRDDGNMPTLLLAGIVTSVSPCVLPSCPSR